MNFRLLACLVTVLGLASVACAVPTISARSPPMGTVTFLDQNNPVGSFVKSQAGTVATKTVELPNEFEEFFKIKTVRESLGYNADSPRIRWTALALDDTYKDHIGKRLPVYAGFKGGPKCQAHCKCLAIIVDDTVGMVSSTGSLVVQVGNPAIVSFTNWGTNVASSEQDKSLVELAVNKVHWLLKEQKVKEALGFTGDPKIVHVDELPHDGFQTQPELHFQLHGGTKCLPKRPCEALISQKDHHGTITAKISDYKQRVIVETQWTSPHQS